MATSAVSQVAIHCVATAGSTPTAPYSDWTTAATNIQDGIDAAQPGEIILVTNGVYAFGGRITAGSTANRAAINKAVLVESVNGPWVTTIEGGNVASGTSAAVRCAWLTNGAALNGFTLTGGGTWTSQDHGGGVCCTSSNAFVANCLIFSNSANFEGGGTYQGTFWNCAIYNNKVSSEGGGTAYSYLNNCTVVGNFGYPGGAYYGGFTNCIIYYNSNANVTAFANYASYCCSYPILSGPRNFTNPPLLFVDNVNLLTNSPCIGAGTNIGLGTDIDGRSWDNPPSVGCGEAPTYPIIDQLMLQFPGSPIGFAANATVLGASPLNCWWLFNGTLLQGNGQFSGTQTANLTAAKVNLADAGGYQLVVSNSFGVVTSAVAQLVIHCVNVNGGNPVAPYTTWATAATNIQDAITTAAAGDVVLVTNGLYATGGKSMDGEITNRVSVDKAILVQSVNGPAATIIQGAWDPVSTNGPGAVRCAWLTNSATLSGFSLYGGATRAASSTGSFLNGGGVVGDWVNGTVEPTVANCVIMGNAANGYGGGACSVTLDSCTVDSNLAFIANVGGTVYGFGSGGGAAFCNLNDCLVTANTAINTGDSSSGGGGAYSCYCTDCAITKNFNTYSGGGAYSSTLINCTITDNQVGHAGNVGPVWGGGVTGCQLTNCIVYLNLINTMASPSTSNSYTSTFSYSCTAPAASGTGNITADPQLLPDGIHLSSTSPCIGAGNGSVVSGTDIDSQPWNNPPSMGCDEWQPAPLIIAQPVFHINLTAQSLDCSTMIAGQAPFALFWNKDGVPIQDNGHYSNSGTTSLTINNFSLDDAGAYQVVVTNSSGSVTSAVAQVVIHAVNAAGANPTAPYSTWTTAATNIQDAINASAVGDIVLVTNGIYSCGGLVMNGDLTNRIAINKAITVMSVNGYAATAIQGVWDPLSTNGPGAIRCAYIADGAILNGFTLQNGATRATGDVSFTGPLEAGGGIYCTSTNGVAFNCVLSNNIAIYGGGIINGTLNNSLVYGNQAHWGGGACNATLNNCTVVNNYAVVAGLGGGTYFTEAKNCIVSNNYDYPSFLPDNYYWGDGVTGGYYYTCTTPAFKAGTGNIAVDPQFLDLFHIASSSPCRGAGSAAYATGTDLDGEPWNNPPSMGCDEVVLSNLVGPLSASVTASTNVLANHPGYLAGNFTGRASSVMWNFGDGVTVSNAATLNHEWTNSGSYPVTFTVYNNDNPAGVSATIMVQVQPINPPQIQPAGVTSGAFQFQFTAQTNAQYTVQYTTNLTPPVTWQTLETIYLNQASSIQVNDSPATNGARFYRVLAQ
jgi:hypothetical protein